LIQTKVAPSVRRDCSRRKGDRRLQVDGDGCEGGIKVSDAEMTSPDIRSITFHADCRPFGQGRRCHEAARLLPAVAAARFQHGRCLGTTAAAGPERRQEAELTAATADAVATSVIVSETLSRPLSALPAPDGCACRKLACRPGQFGTA
jgi:hypothetical protein